MSLLIVGIAIWIALKVADRLVRPVANWSARRGGSPAAISPRASPSRARSDEIGTLGAAFNRMTGRLEEQTGALVGANASSTAAAR